MAIALLKFFAPSSTAVGLPSEDGDGPAAITATTGCCFDASKGCPLWLPAAEHWPHRSRSLATSPQSCRIKHQKCHNGKTEPQRMLAAKARQTKASGLSRLWPKSPAITKGRNITNQNQNATRIQLLNLSLNPGFAL